MRRNAITKILDDFTTIKSTGDDKFIVRVSKVGRVTITVFNKKKKNQRVSR